MRGDNVLDAAEYITAMMFTTFNGLIFNMVEIFTILHCVKERAIKQTSRKYTIVIAAILLINICIIINIYAFVNLFPLPIEKDICVKQLIFFNIIVLLITENVSSFICKKQKGKQKER